MPHPIKTSARRAPGARGSSNTHGSSSIIFLPQQSLASYALSSAILSLCALLAPMRAVEPLPPWSSTPHLRHGGGQQLCVCTFRFWHQWCAGTF